MQLVSVLRGTRSVPAAANSMIREAIADVLERGMNVRSCRRDEPYVSVALLHNKMIQHRSVWRNWH